MTVVEFRTGEEEIPDHLAELMRGIETFTMTYDEAIKAMNAKMERDLISKQYDAVISGHVRRHGGRV